MKTEKQIEKDVFSVVRAAVSDFISGKVYRKGMRPDDARGEDIVVSFLAGTNQQIQSGIVNVNAYVPDVTAKGYSKKVQDIKRLDAIEQHIVAVFENIVNEEYDFAIDDTPVTDSVEGIEEHFINFRVKFRRTTLND